MCLTLQFNNSDYECRKSIHRASIIVEERNNKWNLNYQLAFVVCVLWFSFVCSQKISITQIRKNSSAHGYSTVASISQLDAAYKRKPQDTNNKRKLIIWILFIIPFLNYCGLPVVHLNTLFFYKNAYNLAEPDLSSYIFLNCGANLSLNVLINMAVFMLETLMSS